MLRKRSSEDLYEMAPPMGSNRQSDSSESSCRQQHTKVKLSSSPASYKHSPKRTREGSIDIIKKEDYFKTPKDPKTNAVSDSDESTDNVNLPDPSQNVDPDVFLSQILQAQYGFTLKTKAALDMEDGFFPEITDEQITAYDMKLVVACRENDVETVKSLVEKDGMEADCCNRFGESLLHMACRRGFKEMVEYFLMDVKLGVRIRDDCGRTPLHDACWNPQAQTEILKWLIERDPSLLLISDKRGSTPFQYARPQDWPIWRQFLLDNRTCFDCLKDSKELFS